MAHFLIKDGNVRIFGVCANDRTPVLLASRPVALNGTPCRSVVLRDTSPLPFSGNTRAKCSIGMRQAKTVSLAESVTAIRAVFRQAGMPLVVPDHKPHPLRFIARILRRAVS